LYMSDIVVAKMQSNQVKQTEITEDKIVQFMNTTSVGTELTDTEKKQFIEVAKAYQLNPFKREIYCIPYGSGQYRRLSIITGYEVYLKRADRIGKLDGWRAWTEVREKSNGKKELVGIVEIHRSDWRQPFVHEVFFDEVKQTKKDGSLTVFWSKQPRFQLKKVAISQGFRLCFPDEFGGMPYTADELTEEETIPRDVSESSGTFSREPQEDPDKELRENLLHILQGAIAGALIETYEKDTVIENSKKYSGKVLEAYISKIKMHLEGAVNKSPKSKDENPKDVSPKDVSPKDVSPKKETPIATPPADEPEEQELW
jgi:phage recombination protein Bet